jgi:hypothetical protein
MIPETKHAKRGGAYIAYQSFGKGPLDLVPPGGRRTLSTPGKNRRMRISFNGWRPLPALFGSTREAPGSPIELPGSPFSKNERMRFVP